MTPFSCKRALFALLIAGLLGGVGAAAARADVYLAITTDQTYGVIAGLGSNFVSKTTPENPILALNGGVSSLLVQDGSSLRFAFTLADHSNQFQAAGTFATGQFIFAPLTINIVGTVGEAPGTPVSLRLSTNYFSTGGELGVVNTLNGKNYEFPFRNPTLDTVISGFKVGDSFTYLAGIEAVAGVNASFSGTLSVSPASGDVIGGPSAPVPEPTSLTLLAAGSLTWGAFHWRRQRRRPGAG